MQTSPGRSERASDIYVPSDQVHSLAAVARALAAGALLGLLVGLPGCSNNPYPRDRPRVPRCSWLCGMTQDSRPDYLLTRYRRRRSSISSIPSYFRYHYLKRDPLRAGAEARSRAAPARAVYTIRSSENGRTVRSAASRGPSASNGACDSRTIPVSPAARAGRSRPPISSTASAAWPIPRFRARC